MLIFNPPPSPSNPVNLTYSGAFRPGPNVMHLPFCIAMAMSVKRRRKKKEKKAQSELFASHRLTQLTFCTVACATMVSKRNGLSQPGRRLQPQREPLALFAKTSHTSFKKYRFVQRGPVVNHLLFSFSFCSKDIKSKTPVINF